VKGITTHPAIQSVGMSFLKESKWPKWQAVILLALVTIDVVYFNYRC